jgi:predicted transcriptional regulator
MHYKEMDIIEDLITAKIKGSTIRKNMFLRLLSNANLDYQTNDYELVINRLIKNGKLIETDGFIRHKDSEDLTKLFVEHNGVRGIWASKT